MSKDKLKIGDERRSTRAYLRLVRRRKQSERERWMIIVFLVRVVVDRTVEMK